jgi:hypothetical protein
VSASSVGNRDLVSNVHGRLGVHGVNDNLMLIQARLVRDTLARIKRRTLELQCFRPMK